MSKNIQVFRNMEFGTVRVLDINGEPWFVGKDVADILEYRNGSRDINRHVDEEDRRKIMLFDGNQDKETIIINESGLYSLILSSKLPNAKKFKKWVTSEVLPSIRRTGTYKMPTGSDLIAAAVIEAQKLLAEKDKQIEEMRPAAVFTAAVSSSESTILIGDLAKFLRQNGVDIGQKRLFEKLRQDGFLLRYGSSRNMPSQKAMELGLFKVKEGSYIDSNGNNVLTRTTKVTGKGQVYFVNKYMGYTDLI
nr:MAG TPA: repressor domain protein [Caudoviricetes sp.]